MKKIFVKSKADKLVCMLRRENVRKAKFLLLLAAFALAMKVGAQEVKPFVAGDRVAFVGNSITHGGYYHSYIWLYYMTRFPDAKMWMSSKGIGGDTAYDILYRIEDDVLKERPTVLALTFGMNDTGYFEYDGDGAADLADEKVAEARENFLKIETKLQAAQGRTRMVMAGSSPYDQYSLFNNLAHIGKNDTMRRIVAMQDSVAKANDWEFMDFNAPMVEMIERGMKNDSTFMLCGPDRIHPDNDGHLVMAVAFLRAQGLEGKPVADVCIDAQKGRVVRQLNSNVSGVKSDGSGLSFNYLAKALPMPLDTLAHGWGFSRPMSKVLEYMPEFMELYNKEALAVEGLDMGLYHLMIDNDTIGVFTSETLAEGINLSNYRNTPQYRQAVQVMALNNERWDIEHRFRDYAWVKYNFLRYLDDLPGTESESTAAFYRQYQSGNGWATGYRDCYDRLRMPEVRSMLQRQMKEIVDIIYKVNKPEKHRISLKRLK